MGHRFTRIRNGLNPVCCDIFVADFSAAKLLIYVNAQLLHYLLVIDPGPQPLLPFVQLAHHHAFPAQRDLPAMVRKTKSA